MSYSLFSISLSSLPRDLFFISESQWRNLSFLDSLVTTHNAGFEAPIITKHRNKGLCLNGVPEMLFARHYWRHCEDGLSYVYVMICIENAYKELERLTLVLINNGYSNAYVSDVTRRHTEKYYTHQDTTAPTPTSQILLLQYKYIYLQTTGQTKTSSRRSWIKI